ncbi:hypothetical protein KVR01_003624 [Diaporthe batatas]|uniref:uncharacterized protein n=1 Tax=Diaporthe batatas TaxID=748121 RepID=UPI001D051C7C|nr:uncharacterized protein KVR01_003624 [Diaporthe batatas]KAG8167935.1 hypothetical protein KVR01_003624 [Diaporthe batatas]
MSYTESSQPQPTFEDMFRPWSPADDPDKPPFPYITGFTAQIDRHSAPPPFGQPHYGPGPRPGHSSRYLHDVPQSELVVDHPPLDTPPPPPETARLTVHAPMSVGCHRGAQVVACSVTPHGGGEPFQAVAKIYDALYYRFTESYADAPRDVVREADGDYSREAAAYEHLQATGQTGSFAPAYYGSWTLNLPITSRGKAYLRPVRLILIERLDGPSIKDSLIYNGSGNADKDAFHYPLEYRLEILALAMDGYVRQQHSGIDQWDFAGRNVILAPRLPSNEPAVVVAGMSLPRVVLIDYNTAAVYPLTEMGRPPLMDWPRPWNPMTHFWGLPMNDFWGWVPHEWHDNQKFIQEWLLSRFGTEEKRKLYAPVEREMVIIDDDLPLH